MRGRLPPGADVRVAAIYRHGRPIIPEASTQIQADDEVSSYEDLSSSGKNFSYLAQRARSKAASGSGDVVLSDSGALNSVILESGAEINGDIIIIDDSSGDKTILSN